MTRPAGRVPEWAGRRVMEARAYMAKRLPAPCGKCGGVVSPDKPGTPPGRSLWVVGHIKDRALHPELTWVPSNWQPEHRSCSERSGTAVAQKVRQVAAARAAAASVQPALFESESLRVFPEPETHAEAGRLSFSLPATGEPIDTDPSLAWDPDALRRFPWLAELADVPEDASPPLYMTPVPADAVGSYAAEPCECCGLTALEWIEQAERKRLRWWQRLAITRQLERRADGSLCHEEILESAPRRAGKSVRMRGVALWRMSHGQALFGEVQSVIHTGNNMRICREIQRGAWRWAQERWGGDAVTRANGKEAIESPAGDRWMVFAQDAVYGYDATLALGDECWDVKTETVTEGLEPAMLERSSPQLHLTSTAHRRATSLMRSKIMAVLLGAGDGDGVLGEDEQKRPLVLIWAAPYGSDPGDRAVWRAASPHWSEDRRQFLARKYAKALAGEVDPEADDPDPMAGFVAQYLNVWPVKPTDTARGTPVAGEHDWPVLAVARPAGAPTAAAIEAWYAAGVSLAMAWRRGSRAVVAVVECGSLADAVAALQDSGYRGAVVVGKTLTRDPALRGVRVKPGDGRAGALAGELVRLIAEDAIRHDGGEHLTGQVYAARTVEAADGLRLVSAGRADAIKAAVWAVTAARATTKPDGLRLIVARG